MQSILFALNQTHALDTTSKISFCFLKMNFAFLADPSTDGNYLGYGSDFSKWLEHLVAIKSN